MKRNPFSIPLVTLLSDEQVREHIARNALERFDKHLWLRGTEEERRELHRSPEWKELKCTKS